MTISIEGYSGIAAEVETSQRTMRTTLRPIDIGALGSYRKAQTSGIMAATLSAARTYSFRWAPTPNTNLCLVRRIIISAGGLTAWTAGYVKIDAFAARAMTAIDSSGGTAGTVSGNNGKLRTAMATTSGVTTYISTTGATSAGTETLDTDPFGTIATSVITTSGIPVLPPTDLFYPGVGGHPLVLANQEGFIIKTTAPAGGGLTVGVVVEWDEVVSTAWV